MSSHLLQVPQWPPQSPKDASPCSGQGSEPWLRRRRPFLNGCRSPFGRRDLPALAFQPSLGPRAPGPGCEPGGHEAAHGRRELGKCQSAPALEQQAPPAGAALPDLQPSRHHQRRPSLSGHSSSSRHRQAIRAAADNAFAATATPSTTAPVPSSGSRSGSRSPIPRTLSSAALTQDHLWPASPAVCCGSPLKLTTPSTALPGADSPWAASLLASRRSTPASEVYGSKPASRSSREALFWRRGQEIGFGTYGRVFLAQDKTDGRIFAVKMSRIDKREEQDRKYCDKLQKELDICKDLRHPNIVSCLGHEYVHHRLYIYLEYVAGGSLRHMLDEFGAVEGPMLRKATRGALRGLDYLHTHNPPVVHRDLKGANILVDLDFNVKLADFGCSKRDVSTLSFATVGSVHWVAPEVLQQQGGHGRKADIWSLGCVMIEMATAADPWGKDAFDNFMQGVRCVGFSDRTPPVPETMLPAGQDLVRRCLKRDPTERPWCSELLEHELVAGGSSRAGSRASQRGT